MVWGMVSSSLSLKSKMHPCRCPLRWLLVNSRYKKAPHHCDAAWSQERIVSLYYYYDGISKKHENFPTRPKRKNMTKAFSRNTPLHILEKNRWFCGTVFGENQKFSFRLPRKDAAGVTLYNQNTMQRSEGAHSCPDSPYPSRTSSVLMGNTAHRKTADRMPAAAV